MAHRFWLQFVVVGLLLGAATASFAADPHAVISGVVRDVSGAPQAGAVVQVVSADAIVRATAFTDGQGRYAIQHVLPGLYGVRASAALFLPASRDNLRVQTNRRSVVNLTLSGLLDEFAWIPARAKAADEAKDDWNWTLRSSASRPMLKVAGDDVTDAACEREGRAPTKFISSRAVLVSGTGRFGDGASRVVVRSARTSQDGSLFAVSGSTGSERTSTGLAHPATLATIAERHMGPGALLASRVEYDMHPEIAAFGTPGGLQVLTVSSAEKFDLGDVAEIEAGNRLRAVMGGSPVFASRPFLRVSAHTGPGMAVAYNLATSRDADDYESAIWQERPGFAPAAAGSRAGFEKGLHQEVSVSRRTRGSMLAVAFYADALDRVALGGGGTDRALSGFTSPDPASVPEGLLVDQGNGSFQAVTGEGYRNSGFNVLLTRAMGAGTWVTLQYSTGTALAVAAGAPRKPESDLPALHARKAQSATVSVKANIARTGTKLRTSYRWQPDVLVTSVDPYDVLPGGEYLSVHLRQPLRFPGMLPDGLELTVDGTNMLAEGRQEFSGRNGRPLYLAASPRCLQAGLAFNF